MSGSSRSYVTFIIYPSLSLLHLIHCPAMHSAAAALLGSVISNLEINLERRTRRKHIILTCNICCFYRLQAARNQPL